MRRQLVLSTLRSAAKTLGILAAPVLALQCYVVAYRKDLADEWFALPEATRLLAVVLYYLGVRHH